MAGRALDDERRPLCASCLKLAKQFASLGGRLLAGRRPQVSRRPSSSLVALARAKERDWKVGAPGPKWMWRVRGRISVT